MDIISHIASYAVLGTILAAISIVGDAVSVSLANRSDIGLAWLAIVISGVAWGFSFWVGFPLAIQPVLGFFFGVSLIVVIVLSCRGGSCCCGGKDKRRRRCSRDKPCDRSGCSTCGGRPRIDWTTSSNSYSSSSDRI